MIGDKSPCGPFSSTHELCEPEYISKPLWASSGSLGLGCLVRKLETCLSKCRRLNVEKIKTEESHYWKTMGVKIAMYHLTPEGTTQRI